MQTKIKRTFKILFGIVHKNKYSRHFFSVRERAEFHKSLSSLFVCSAFIFCRVLSFIRYIGVDFTFGLLDCVRYNGDFIISIRYIDVLSISYPESSGFLVSGATPGSVCIHFTITLAESLSLNLNFDLLFLFLILSVFQLIV